MDILKLHGVIIKSADYSEFDRRLTLLTIERGKITVFARNVKRPGNKLMASTEPFVFGTFLLTEGRSAYNLRDTEISNYFEDIRKNLDAFYLGSYFLEFADYYSRENVEDRPLISLIYSSLLALLRGDFENELIRAVFEIKIISIEGELPLLPREKEEIPGLKHTIGFIVDTEPEKLFTFKLSAKLLSELTDAALYFRQRAVRHDFSSLQIMDQLF